MPNRDAPPLTRGVVLRGIVFGIAVALGALAVWLVAIAHSTKSVQIGVIVGLWGALLGAFSMFSGRRPGAEHDDAQLVTEVPAGSAHEVAMRSNGEVERMAAANARRAFEDRLEQMLRRELAREVGDLRSEIAGLRQDLLDKVGGQLRLERIETTRVIGSDLEALQHEVRQLKQASETGMLHELGLAAAAPRLVVEQASVRPAVEPSPEVRSRADAPAPVETTGPIRVAVSKDSHPHPSTHPAPPVVNGTPPPAPVPPPPAPPVTAGDPFASLPRITPFTEFELDPVDTTSSQDEPVAADRSEQPEASPVAPANPAYTGRRRRTDEVDPDAGRHSRHDAAARAVPVGGRRRRVDDDVDSEPADGDLLSRLLARGTADH